MSHLYVSIVTYQFGQPAQRLPVLWENYLTYWPPVTTCGVLLILVRKRVWSLTTNVDLHDDVVKWKYFPRYWPFVRIIHRSPVNYPHKGQWRGVLMFSLICAWINGRVNNGEADDLRPHRSLYDVTVMAIDEAIWYSPTCKFTGNVRVISLLKCFWKLSILNHMQRWP